MNTKIALTVIILAHRNDQRLRQAIKSTTFADQLLVIDPHNQIDFAPLKKIRPFKKVVMDVEATTEMDFGSIRNEAIEFAKNDWVLYLDSDEVVSSDSIPEIKNLLAQTTFVAAYIKRVDIFHNYQMKWGEVGDHWLLRIAKKDAITFLRPVHEVAKSTGNVTRSDIIIKHYAHQNISEFISKIGYYAQLDAKHRQQYHQHFSIWQMLAYPFAKFVSNYFIKRGFKDGWRGLVYAVIMSLHSFFVRIYLYQIEYSN